MIQHKFLVVKNLDEATKELDNLMMYEGYMVLCCIGKKNNTLLLRRILEQPEEAIVPQTKRTTKKPTSRFPNAVVR